MASEIPIVRYFIPCLEIVVTPDGKNVTLANLIHSIARLPGESFPCIREQMALYALLANGRGEHQFEVELVFFDEGKEHLRATALAKGGLRPGSVKDPWLGGSAEKRHVRETRPVYLLPSLRRPADC
jgi:hypothetical protein